MEDEMSILRWMIRAIRWIIKNKKLALKLFGFFVVVVGSSYGLAVGIFGDNVGKFVGFIAAVISSSTGISILVFGIYKKKVIDSIKDIKRDVSISSIAVVDNINAIDSRISDIKRKIESDIDDRWDIDSGKRFVAADEMRELWPKIILSTRYSFSAVNYLSKVNWDKRFGDELVVLLTLIPYMRSTQAGRAPIFIRRVFIIDNKKELESWSGTLMLHNRYRLPWKYILKEDFDNIIGGDGGILGFNVIDTGHTCRHAVKWNYIGRETSGSDLYRDSKDVKKFSDIFEDIWEESSTAMPDEYAGSPIKCAHGNCPNAVVPA